MSKDDAKKTERKDYEDRTERYGGGFIESRHGRVNGWLLVVYAVLILWGIYYGFEYWGGLGPGLDY